MIAPRIRPRSSCQLSLFLLALLSSPLHLSQAVSSKAGYDDEPYVPKPDVEYTFGLHPCMAQKADPKYSPDCFLNRHLLIVKDKNPGPTIRAEVGDMVRVTLKNNSPSQAVTLHFHGLTMKGQPYVDGTAHSSQCALGPMQTQVYDFHVLDVGTHYWHGQTSMDRADGVQGAIIVTYSNDKDERSLSNEYDGEGLLFLQDWFHKSGTEYRAGLDSDPVIFREPQSFLINVLGQYEGCIGQNMVPDSCANSCDAEEYMSMISVEKGKTYRLRIVGGATLVGVNVRIDNQKMRVVEVDGTLVLPFEVDDLTVMPGQRFSVLVTADQDVDNYWIITSPEGGFAYVHYDGAPSGPPGGGVTVAYRSVLEGVQQDAKLFMKDIRKFEYSAILTAPRNIIRELFQVITMVQHRMSNLNRFAVNNIIDSSPARSTIYSAYREFHAPEARPWPHLEVSGTVTVPDRNPNPFNYSAPVPIIVSNLHRSGPTIIKLSYGEVVEIVLQNVPVESLSEDTYTWHLHGHKFYVVGMGIGVHDSCSDPQRYYLIDPVRRDTVAVHPFGWTAIRFVADNPGVWPMLCTQNAYEVMGLGFDLIVSPDLLPRPPPGIYSCLKTSLDPRHVEVCSSYQGEGMGSKSSKA